MKTILSRLFTSAIVAVITAALVTTVALAATYYISENSLYYVSGVNTQPSTIASGGCVGSQCRFLYQNANISVFRWAYTQNNVINWYVYDPTIGEAAAKYGVRITGSPNWDIVVNQANAGNKGKYVYIGYSDNVPNSGGYVMLHNGCIPGYWCGGLRVFWDSMSYTR